MSSETKQQNAFITGIDTGDINHGGHGDDDEDRGGGLDDLLETFTMRDKVTKAPELKQVRKDHGKLMGVVRTFGEKVGGMIDKQRYEFMTAYEHHIQDIQNELQSLREKVTEISGEETRKAKLESLDENQTKFRADALALDTESLSQRKQLRKLLNKLHSVERDRDWVFKRLKTAKKHYAELSGAKEALVTQQCASYEASIDRGGPAGGGYGSQQQGQQFYGARSADDDLGSVGSLDSSSSVETGDLSIYMGQAQGGLKAAHTAASTRAAIEKKAKDIFGVHRENALLSVLPHIAPVSSQAASANPNVQRQQALLRESHQQAQASMGGMGRSQSMPALQGSPTKAAVRKSREERDAIGELVALRARQEEIRDFVSQCASSCDKGPWATLPKRPIGELLSSCRTVVEDMDAADAEWASAASDGRDGDSQGGGGSSYGELPPDPYEEQRLLLAMELAAVPEVYFIISDLLAGHDSLKAKQEAMRHSAWSANALASSHSRHGEGTGTEEEAYPEQEQRVSSSAGEGAIPTQEWSQQQPASSNSNVRTGAPTTAATAATALSAAPSSGHPESKTGEGSAAQGLDAGEGSVVVNNWYDADAPRTALGAGASASRGGEELSGFYRGSTGEAAAARELDLVGGGDLAGWLAHGAAERADAANQVANSLRRQAGEEVEDDFMLFD